LVRVLDLLRVGGFGSAQKCFQQFASPPELDGHVFPWYSGTTAHFLRSVAFSNAASSVAEFLPDRRPIDQRDHGGIAAAVQNFSQPIEGN
jgi:hypothetical protein